MKRLDNLVFKLEGVKVVEKDGIRYYITPYKVPVEKSYQKIPTYSLILHTPYKKPNLYLK